MHALSLLSLALALLPAIHAGHIHQPRAHHPHVAHPHPHPHLHNASDSNPPNGTAAAAVPVPGANAITAHSAPPLAHIKAALRIAPARPARCAPNPGFVTARDGHLYIGSDKWDFRGFNSPQLLTANQFEMEDTMRSIATGFARPVTRTYTLRVGPTVYMNASEAHIMGWDDAKQDWKYNEEQFKVFDQAMATAAKYGVKIVFPIINQDYGLESNDYVGNFRDLIRQRFSILNYTTAQTEVDFFTNTTIRADFFKIVKHLLTRRNTVNGRVYGHDDTFLAFETGNEMQWLVHHKNGTTENRGAPPADWTLEYAKEIRKYAPKTLILDGSLSRTLGKAGVETYWRKEVLESPLVELFSYHFYGAGDAAKAPEANDYVRKFGKTFTPLEVGFYNTVDDVNSIIPKDPSAGSLLWSFRPHSRLGGFVVHGEGDDIYSYHVPGWTPPRDPKNFDKREVAYVEAARAASYAVVDEKLPTIHPIPNAPEPFVTSVNGSKALSFRGAAWAKYYDIWEVKTGARSDWFKALKNVTDNVAEGTLAFSVPLVQSGGNQNQTMTNATGAWYIVVPFSVEGIPGAWGGPLYIPFK